MRVLLLLPQENVGLLKVLALVLPGFKLILIPVTVKVLDSLYVWTAQRQWQ